MNCSLFLHSSYLYLWKVPVSQLCYTRACALYPLLYHIYFNVSLSLQLHLLPAIQPQFSDKSNLNLSRDTFYIDLQPIEKVVTLKEAPNAFILFVWRKRHSLHPPIKWWQVTDLEWLGTFFYLPLNHRPNARAVASLLTWRLQYLNRS